MSERLEIIRRLLRDLICTEEDEIACEDCFAEVDRFVEKELAGEDVSELMPMVQAHLCQCRDCREEYEALVDALKSTDD